MILDILIPFISIFLAEFGDKTQIAILSLSMRYKNYYQIFFGVMFAFILIDGLAIYFAKEISIFIPILYIKLISALIFILFGLLGLIEIAKNKKNKINKNKINAKNKNLNQSNILNNYFKKINYLFSKSFFIILFAEFGDKSQIAAGVFATIYNPIFVFFGVILALSILTLFAIIFGKYLFNKFDKDKIEKIANYIFIIIGMITLTNLII